MLKLEKLSRNKLYPVEGPFKTLIGVPYSRLRAKWTGEKRPPKKGEFYLSGSAITAYQALEDLTSSFHIAALYEVEQITTYKIVRKIN